MIHTPDGAYDPEWQDLARKITQGDGLQWTGDPDLWLGLGVVKEVRNGRPTGRTGRRLEVWRSCEDGADRLIGHWHPGEAFRVCFDLARMRADSPGHVDVQDEIDKANAAKEKAASDEWRENAFQAMEQAAWLHVKRHEPRIKHAVTDNPLAKSAPDASE